MRLARASAALALGIALLTLPATAPAAGPPQLGAAWIASATTTTAGLRAETNPNGLATAYHFSYLSEAAYEANLAAGHEAFAGAAKAPTGADPSLGSGSTAVTASAQISGLGADTPYRFRLVAANSAGGEVGPGHLFYSEPFAAASTLPDGRAWEMVTPPDKGGAPIQALGQVLGGGDFQAAADGDSLTFSSTASFGAAQGAPPVSQYLSVRGANGWATANISTPTAAGAYGTAPAGSPYRLFSPDLTQAVMLSERRCGEAEPCPGFYSLRDGAGAQLAATPAAAGLRLVGASSDLSVLILSTCAALTADATEAPLGGGCDPARPNLYRWSGGALTLLNLLPGESQGAPGATLAAPLGAISANRAYFTHAGNLYLREGNQTVQVDEALGGGGDFEAASADGSVAYLTKGGHLYRYQAPGGALADLTPAGEVLGVLAAASDGSRVYYATAAGIFMRQGATTTTIATGPEAAQSSDYPPATATARLSPDGTHLAFLSVAPLTGYDNRDADTGAPQSELYLYDVTTTTLTCASCDPTGERPLGPSTIPAPLAAGPAAPALYVPRSLAADGRRLFFDSSDSLALADSDQKPDVYEWEAQGVGGCARAIGCLALISRGRSSAGSAFVDASSSGSDVFFLTEDSLVGSDTGAADVYDAREGGGIPEAPRPIECAGDACQFLPSEPEDPGPGTLNASGGNPALRIQGEAKPTCPKGKVRKRGRCMKKKHKRHKRPAAKRRERRG
jgi:hypothetical protein